VGDDGGCVVGFLEGCVVGCCIDVLKIVVVVVVVF
jgi:hypothetical protein